MWSNTFEHLVKKVKKVQKDAEKKTKSEGTQKIMKGLEVSEASTLPFINSHPLRKRGASLDQYFPSSYEKSQKVTKRRRNRKNAFFSAWINGNTRLRGAIVT